MLSNGHDRPTTHLPYHTLLFCTWLLSVEQPHTTNTTELARLVVYAAVYVSPYDLAGSFALPAINRLTGVVSLSFCSKNNYFM